jgi:hypothetical protein
MLMAMAPIGFWIADRVAAERPRDGIGEQMLMPMRPPRAAANLRIGSELFWIGRWQEPLCG